MSFNDFYAAFGGGSQQQFERPGQQQNGQSLFGRSNIGSAMAGYGYGYPQPGQDQGGQPSLPFLGAAYGRQGGLGSYANLFNSPADNSNGYQPTGYEAMGAVIGQGLGALLKPLGRNGSSNVLADAVGFEPFGGGGWGGG